MSLAAQLHSEHQERLIRLGASKPSAPAIRDKEIDVLNEAVRSLTEIVNQLRRKMADHSEIIGRFVALETDEKPRFQEIIDVVCDYYDVSKNDVLSARRTGVLVQPRQIICYLARNLTGMSFPQMGPQIRGSRSHYGPARGQQNRRSNPQRPRA